MEEEWELKGSKTIMSLFEIRNLNKPYTRFGMVIQGVCCIMDGVVALFTLGYISSNFQMWWIDKMLAKTQTHYRIEYNSIGDKNV